MNCNDEDDIVSSPEEIEAFRSAQSLWREQASGTAAQCLQVIGSQVGIDQQMAGAGGAGGNFFSLVLQVLPGLSDEELISQLESHLHECYRLLRDSAFRDRYDYCVDALLERGSLSNDEMLDLLTVPGREG